MLLKQLLNFKVIRSFTGKMYAVVLNKINNSMKHYKIEHFARFLNDMMKQQEFFGGGGVHAHFKPFFIINQIFSKMFNISFTG